MATHNSEHEGATNLTEYLQTLRDVIRLKSDNCSQECTQITVSNQQAALAPKTYGRVTVSGNAKAHLGDIYRFCDNDHVQQQRVLQEYKEQIEKFSQRQNDQSARLEQALALIAEISQNLRMKENKSKKNSTQGSLGSKQYLSRLLSFSKDERRPEESLELAKSFVRRAPLKPTSYVDPKHYIPQLDSWLTSTGSVLLHLTADTLAREKAGEIAVQLTAGLKASAYPIAWFLPIMQEQVTTQALTRNLIVQLLEHHLDAEVMTNAPIDAISLEENRSKAILFELLTNVLKGVRKCFAIIELPNQSGRSPDWNQDCDQVVKILRSAVAQAAANGNVLKVLLVTHRTELNYLQSVDAASDHWPCILKATPINLARARQLAASQQRLLLQQLQKPVLMEGQLEHCEP